MASTCAESPYLLHDVLKKQWGFKGFVISDWGSTYSHRRHREMPAWISKCPAANP